MAQSRLTAVREEEAPLLGEEQPRTPLQLGVPRGASREAGTQQAALTDLLLMSLRSLSQRAVAALGNLYALALAASTFWVYLTILATPTTPQLIGAGMYSIFVIACLFLKRRA